MAPAGPIFVVGSGPMIGSHVANLFATHGFPVALFSRSASNLAQNSSFIISSAPSASVSVYPADVTDDAALTTALQKAVSELGVPEIVVYNAARINYGVKETYKATDIIEDFKIPNLGLHTTANVLLPHLQALAKTHPGSHPALFITSGAIIHQPFAPVFSLCMAKSAQASLAKLLAEENKDLVHVALVTVGGPVSPKDEVNNPANIATKFWDLYKQQKGAWGFELKSGW